MWSSWVLRSSVLAISTCGLLLLTGCGGSSSQPSGPAQAPDRAAAADAVAGAVPPAGKRVVGYYANYKMYHGYEPAAVPFSQLTDVNYAFVFIANGSAYYTSPKYYPNGLPATGTCAPSDYWGDIQRPTTVNGTEYKGGYAAINKGGKSINPALKTFLSLGGYQQIVSMTTNGDTDTKTNGDVPWGLITKDEASMDAFVASCVSLVNQNGFDGVDVDWEFPTAQDTPKFVKLLSKFRAALGGAPLTIAGPPDAARIANQGGAAAAASIDWINVMSYDYYGAWVGQKTDMNAPLSADPADPNPNAATFNVSSAIGVYLASGFPANKVVLGVPFYGRTFSGVTNANNGLFQAWKTPGPGEGSLTYKELQQAPYKDYAQTWSDTQQVPYAFDAASGTFISFDNAKSIGLKASYAKTNGLKGAMIWELAGDTPSNDLLNAINTNLG